MKAFDRFVALAKSLILSAMLAGAIGTQAIAQQISDEHLQAAKSAMQATGATERLDGILPEVAAFTKTGLIANRPDIEAEISQIVDEVAISIAPRRGPLEDEVALIYANLFSAEELTQIESFFRQ